MLSDSRRAIVLRMLLTGSSCPGVMEGAAGAAARGAEEAAGAGAAAAGCPPADHASMSRLMMRPPGPLPGTDDNGMFCWAAMLRASGLALRRPPSPSAAWAPAGGGLGAGCGAACGAGAGCGATGAAGACAAGSARGAGGGGGEAWGAAAGAAAAPPAEATIAEMSSSGPCLRPGRGSCGGRRRPGPPSPCWPCPSRSRPARRRPSRGRLPSCST